MGFIDEFPYTGLGTGLQSQREGIEIRTDKILSLFHRLQKNINEWELSIRNFPSSATEIHKSINILSKDVASLSNQALLAAVSTAIHRDISNLGDVLARIKLHGLRKMNSQIDQPVLGSNTQAEPSTPLEMNLSIVTGGQNARCYRGLEQKLVWYRT